MPFVCALALRSLCLCGASLRAEVPRHFLKVQRADCEVYNTKWHFFNGFGDTNVRKGLVLSRICCCLLCLLFFRHLVLTKQPFILRMNLVNPRVRKPVIRLCNILWWLHQALHHWLDYRGSGLLTHNLPANTHMSLPTLVLIEA